MTVEMKAYRLNGDQEKMLDMLRKVRHITYREYDTYADMADIVIIIVRSDMQALMKLCKEFDVSAAFCGTAQMAMTNDYDKDFRKASPA